MISGTGLLCLFGHWTLVASFMPIKAPSSEFTHRSVVPPVSYEEFVHVQDRVPDGLAAPVFSSAASAHGEDIMTIQQQRLQSLQGGPGSSPNMNTKKPAITFEEVSLTSSYNSRNRSSKAYPRRPKNATQEEDFRPSEPVFPQGLYYQSNRRDFGVSVNPILSPYGNNEIHSPEFSSNDYNGLEVESLKENNEGSFGVTVEPLTMSQIYNQQLSQRPLQVQYIINEESVGSGSSNEDESKFIANEVKDIGAESEGIFTPPKVMAHPALVKWTTTTTQVPPITTPKIEYAQHIDALHYFPPSSPIDEDSGFKKKPLKEKIQKNPLPNLSLLYLGKHGPSFPIFNKLMTDLHGSMERLMGNPLDMFKNNPGSFFTLIRSFFSNASIGSYGDNNFDVYDFIPFLAVLIAAILIFAGTFPNGINVLGLNQSTLPLGRRMDDETLFERALNQLESGVMMISAIRHEESCSAKLACKFGVAAKESFPNKDMLLGAVNFLIGERFDMFSRSFENAMEGRDESSCEVECTRCMAI